MHEMKSESGRGRRGTAKDPGRILDVVIELLETRGFDGWQLRDVADGARASLATIYGLHSSREELIVAAVEKWMAKHAYEPLSAPPPGTAPLDALIGMFHAIFEPWERHPGMLDVFVRATQTDSGTRLHAQGAFAAAPLGDVLASLDPAFAADLGLILPTIVYGALARYQHRSIAVTDILKIIETTLRCLPWPDQAPPKRGMRKLSLTRPIS